MRIFIFSIIFSIIFFAVCGCTHKKLNLPVRTHASQSIVDEIADNLKKYRVTHLAKPIYLFHYENRTVNSGIDHFKKTVDYYWSRYQDNSASRFINGLYLATNPVASRSYSGFDEDFSMSRIEVSTSAVILSLAYLPDSESISDLTLKELKDYGCKVDNYLTIFESNNSSACRDIALAVLKKLDVHLIQYNYSAERFEACPAESLSESYAYILISLKSISDKEIVILNGTKSTSEKDDQERKILRSIFLSEAKIKGSSFSYPYFDSSVEKSRSSIEAAIKYSSDHIVTCKSGSVRLKP